MRSSPAIWVSLVSRWSLAVRGNGGLQLRANDGLQLIDIADYRDSALVTEQSDQLGVFWIRGRGDADKRHVCRSRGARIIYGIAHVPASFGARALEDLQQAFGIRLQARPVIGPDDRVKAGYAETLQGEVGFPTQAAGE